MANGGTPWTADQCAQLRALLDGGATFAEISQRIDRKPASIRTKIRDMLAPRDETVPNRPWTDEEVADLLRLCADGVSFVQIGLRLGRRGYACSVKYYDMQRKSPPRDPVRQIADPVAIADRDARRSLEHRSLTSALFGDPLPGYSALDLRGRV